MTRWSEEKQGGDMKKGNLGGMKKGNLGGTAGRESSGGVSPNFSKSNSRLGHFTSLEMDEDEVLFLCVF
jgi:hypothetical protein